MISAYPQLCLDVRVPRGLRLEIRLGLATHTERTQVFSNPFMVQLDTSALGREVNESAVSALPLVNRNYTHIAGLSPGVTAGVPQRRRAWEWRNSAFTTRQIQLMSMERGRMTTAGKRTALTSVTRRVQVQSAEESLGTSQFRLSTSGPPYW